MSAPVFRGATAIVAATLVALAVTDARAQDGGVRSVLASGAGSRALAMGGAFVGVADDASAIVWNPGGLGSLPWVEVQATHSRYAEFGSREEYVALVIPDWRWGTVGLAIRHFGIGGVEGRDDRNLPVEGDLSSSESEVTVGYGRSLSAALSVGGALKLQRQSVAGASGSGLGADLGILVRPSALLSTSAAWLERVSWGTSVRNLIQPSIRLDQESVRDPAVLRSGFAYVHPFGAQRALLAIDVEKTNQAGTRLHAGVEMRLHPLLGLRTGMNGSTLSAGAAFSWRGLRIDYGYQDRDLTGVHSVGVSRALGRSVTERREAASRAREGVIQARLDEAFQARQLEQLDELLTQVRAAEERGDLDAALDLLATAAILYPGDRRVAALQARCHQSKGRQLEAAGDFASAALAYGRALAMAPADTASISGQLRCRIESDRRAARTESLRRLFSRASDAFAADSLVVARARFANILAIDPTDADAAQMLRRTEQALAQRVAGLLAQARQSIRTGQLVVASGFLAEARTLEPKASGLSEVASLLERARAAAGIPSLTRGRTTTAPNTTAGSRRVSSPALPRAQLEALYQAGLRASAEKRAEDARRYWELVWSSEPTYKQVREYLKRELLMHGMELLAAGRLDEAVASWERLLEIEPDNRRASIYIMRARTQQARARELVGTDR